MEDRILATRCPVVILILISFPSTSIPGYFVTMTVLELKVDRLSAFLDATSISIILTGMLPLDTRFHLSKILWRTVYWRLSGPVVILIFKISFLSTSIPRSHLSKILWRTAYWQLDVQSLFSFSYLFPFTSIPG